MRHNKGLILLTTLMLMQILVILSMAFVFQYGGLVKQLSQTFENERIHITARKFLEETIRSSPHFQQCLIKVTDQSWLVHQRKTWWQTHACVKKIKDQEYYYVVESLEKNVCALDDREKSLVVNYYRVTLNIFHDDDSRSSLTLQHVYAMPASQIKECLSQKLHISPGLQAEQILSMD